MIKILKKNTEGSNLKMAEIYKKLSKISTNMGNLKMGIKYSLRNISYLKSFYH